MNTAVSPLPTLVKLLNSFFYCLTIVALKKKPQEFPLKEKLLPLKAAENSFTDVNAVSSN